MPADEISPNWLLGPRTSWTNYHQNFTKRIEGVYLLSNAAARSEFEGYNNTTAAIQKLVRKARGVRELHPVGSGWSMSEIAATSGRFINNKNLKYYFGFKDDRQMDSEFAGDRSKVYCFQAGMTIKAMSRALERKRLSLPTSGASNGQTIAGALSTGTHGSAIRFGAIPEFVVGLHLATGKATSIWLERDSDPILAPGMVEFFGAKLERNDEIFNAALVGLGAFGAILSVTIRAVPRYLLEVHIKELPNDQNLQRAMDSADFTGLAMGHPTERPYHFSLVVNPHRPETVYVTLMYKRRYKKDYPRHDFSDPDSGLGDDALNILASILDGIPLIADIALPGVVSSQLEDRYEEVAGAMGTHAEVFPATKTRGKIGSTAIAVSAEDATRALRLVLDVHDSAGPFPGALGIRFVKGTQATLGFTRFPRSCVIEADGIDNNLARTFNRALWKAFAQSDIEHTIHWGKLNKLTEQRVRAMYGDQRVDSWLKARRKLVPPTMRPVFDNAFLRRAGLAE